VAAQLVKEAGMKKKLSPTQQWMADHPDDVPCPRSNANAWRVVAPE
jgi:hypothetical protein